MKKIFLTLSFIIIPMLGFCQAHYPLYIYKLDRIYDTTFVKTETTSLINIIAGNKSSIINYNDTLIYWSSIQNKWVAIGSNAGGSIDTTKTDTIGHLATQHDVKQKVDKTTSNISFTNDSIDCSKTSGISYNLDTVDSNITLKGKVANRTDQGFVVLALTGNGTNSLTLGANMQYVDGASFNNASGKVNILVIVWFKTLSKWIVFTNAY
jgi:hypothetical protein